MQLHGRYMALYDGTLVDIEQVAYIRKVRLGRRPQVEVKLKHGTQDATDGCIYVDEEEGDEIIDALTHKGDMCEAYIRKSYEMLQDAMQIAQGIWGYIGGQDEARVQHESNEEQEQQGATEEA